MTIKVTLREAENKGLIKGLKEVRDPDDSRQMLGFLIVMFYTWKVKYCKRSTNTFSS